MLERWHAVSAVDRREQVLWAEASTAEPQFEVKVRCAGAAGVAAVGDVLSRCDVVADGDVIGAHEAGGRAELFEEWFSTIEAPLVDLAVFETSGHRPLWEQPDEFVDFMSDTVLRDLAERAER